MSSKQIEIIEIDRKYESYRIQSGSREKILFGSIAERGIDEAVSGVSSIETGKYILLDGFKRLRCAIKLGHRQITFTSLCTCLAFECQVKCMSYGVPQELSRI